MQATVQILKGLWRLTFFSLCSLPLVLLDLDQPAGLVLNIPYYFHCSVLRHLPNAERFEFHTGRSVFICLQKHFSRAASCGHATIQAAPAPLSHLSKLKGSMKKDLQNHAHCFHNRFSVNHREKHVDFWDYKALFSPVESATFLLFPSTMSFIFQTHGSRPCCTLLACDNPHEVHFVPGFLFVHGTKYRRNPNIVLWASALGGDAIPAAADLR